MPVKNQDDESSALLLQRLNRLKKSNVTFSKSSPLHHYAPLQKPSSLHDDSTSGSLRLDSGNGCDTVGDAAVGDDDDDDDSNLAARFLKLQNQNHHLRVEKCVSERGSHELELSVAEGEDDGDIEGDIGIRDAGLKSLERHFLKEARESLARESLSDKAGNGGKEGKEGKEREGEEEGIVKDIEAGAQKLADVATKRVYYGDVVNGDGGIFSDQDVERSNQLDKFTSTASTGGLSHEQLFAMKVPKHQDALDSREADEHITRVLDELTLETVPEDEDNENGEEGESEMEDDSSETESEDTAENSSIERNVKDEKSFSLPEAPSGDVVSKSTISSSIREENEPTSPCTGGALLPEVPTFAPSQRRPARTSKNTSSTPQYTDEDIESWCVICNEDATVKCLGCDGDLYCAECWDEGHMTRDSGYEERGHKKIGYLRKK